MSFSIFSKSYKVVAIFRCIQKHSIKDREMIFVVLDQLIFFVAVLKNRP